MNVVFHFSTAVNVLVVRSITPPSPPFSPSAPQSPMPKTPYYGVRLHCTRRSQTRHQSLFGSSTTRFIRSRPPDSASSIFYALQFPISIKSSVKRFSGNGPLGYYDGDASSAQFEKPMRFSVDLSGNVYVADRINKVIRKISSKYVSTTVGGFYGPAKNGSFSNDFDLTFIPVLPYIVPHTERFQPMLLQRNVEALPNQYGEVVVGPLLDLLRAAKCIVPHRLLKVLLRKTCYC